MEKGIEVTPSPALLRLIAVSPRVTTRHNFTGQFLRGGRLLARRARELESSSDWPLAGQVQEEHRACVVGALVQAAMSLEAQINYVLWYGPKAHLGSNGHDPATVINLEPIAKSRRNIPTLVKVQDALRALGKAPLEEEADPYKATRLLIDVRNSWIHYKARWNEDEELVELNGRIAELGLGVPPGHRPADDPHAGWMLSCLAHWSVDTAEVLIREFFGRLGVDSPI